jgi:hypothetical protein
VTKATFGGSSSGYAFQLRSKRLRPLFVVVASDDAGSVSDRCLNDRRADVWGKETRSWPKNRPVGSNRRRSSFASARLHPRTRSVDDGRNVDGSRSTARLACRGAGRKLRVAIAGSSRARVRAPGEAALADAWGRALRVTTCCLIGRDGSSGVGASGSVAEWSLPGDGASRCRAPARWSRRPAPRIEARWRAGRAPTSSGTVSKSARSCVAPARGPLGEAPCRWSWPRCRCRASGAPP